MTMHRSVLTKAIDHLWKSTVFSVRHLANNQSTAELGNQMKMLNTSKQYPRVLELFDQFNENNIDQCSNWAVIQALTACTEMKDVARGIKIHHLISSRLKRDPYVLPALIHFYMQCHDVDCAEKLFQSSTQKTLPMYGAMMKGFIINKLYHRAINVFSQIKSPNEVTIILFLNACAHLGTEKELNLVKEISSNMPPKYFAHPHVLTSLIDALMKCGDPIRAESIFQSSTNKTLATYGAMMKGFITNRLPNRAIDIFEQIKNPNSTTTTLFFHACAQLGTQKELALVKRVSPAALQSLGTDPYVLTSLIDALMKCGDPAEAESLFQTIPTKTLPMYGALMTGFTINDMSEKVIDVFERIDYRLLYGNIKIEGHSRSSSAIRIDNFEKTVTIILCLIKALAQIGLSDVAQRCIKDIPSLILNDHRVQSALIDMWGKVECVKEAKRIFETTSRRDHVVYTAMINAYGLNGMGVEAVDLYRQMPKEFINDLTHTCVLNACSHSGLVNVAREIFDSITTESDIIFATMVDCLSRIGAFEEAKKLIERFELKNAPSMSMYMALLSGARNEKNSDLAKEVVHRIQRVFPKSKDTLTAASVLLANTYASSGDVDEAFKIRKQLLESGVRRVAGVSMTEVDGKILKFRAHDRSHPNVDEIYATVDRISKELVKHGHEYNSSWVIRRAGQDETVESILCGHSERLAIAAHFLGDRKPKRIQITKNLRVCGDCHQATKLIASIFECEIIVRDANRIHHFRTNGQCSCQDHF